MAVVIGRFCGDCKAVIPGAEWIAHREKHRHPNGHWSKDRDRSTQAAFRRKVLERAGHQCEWVFKESGQRCPVVRPLQAHHKEAGNNDPATGVALCSKHHRQMDRHAR